jgi:3-hydroxyisobutyrate dehydrogenase
LQQKHKMELAGVVACIGLGAMGGPLAHRLLVEGATRGTVRRMVLWDRVTEAGTRRAAEWSSQGAAAGVEVTSVASLEELGRAQPQWVVTCLPTSADVASVATALAPHLAPSTTTVWIDCTSGDPQATRALANRLAQREPGHGQVVLVDAALSGGPRGAAAGTLTVMVGGTKDNVALVTPVISTFAREIVHAGGVGTVPRVQCRVACRVCVCGAYSQRWSCARVLQVQGMRSRQPITS